MFEQAFRNIDDLGAPELIGQVFAGFQKCLYEPGCGMRRAQHG